jgi:hypothetical protein
MNRRQFIQLLARILFGMIVIVIGAAFFQAAMIALSPSQYEHECPAVTLKDEFGISHEIQPSQL